MKAHGSQRPTESECDIMPQQNVGGIYPLVQMNSVIHIDTLVAW